MARQTQNLYELYPTRAVGWETGDDGRVTLLMPRFTNRLVVRLLVPLLRNNEIRLRLDELGSFVWEHCDGGRTVAEIAAAAQERFPEAEGMLARVGEFVAQLGRRELMQVGASPPAAPAR